jgi:hypothetical protein
MPFPPTRRKHIKPSWFDPFSAISPQPSTSPRPTRNPETPVFTRRPEPIEDLTLFVGLPLFDL